MIIIDHPPPTSELPQITRSESLYLWLPPPPHLIVSWRWWQRSVAENSTLPQSLTYKYGGRPNSSSLFASDIHAKHTQCTVLLWSSGIQFPTIREIINWKNCENFSEQKPYQILKVNNCEKILKNFLLNKFWSKCGIKRIFLLESKNSSTSPHATVFRLTPPKRLAVRTGPVHPPFQRRSTNEIQE